MNILGKYATLDSSFTVATEFTEIDGWDSLKHVQFILDVEKEMNLKMTPEQLISCTSIDKIIEAVK